MKKLYIFEIMRKHIFNYRYTVRELVHSNIKNISEKYSIENKVMIAPKETTVVSLVHDTDESGYLRSSQLTYQNGNKNKKYVMLFEFDGDEVSNITSNFKIATVTSDSMNLLTAFERFSILVESEYSVNHY